MSALVTNISWNRTYFQLDYECTDGEELLLFRIALGRFVRFATYERERIDGGERVHAEINLVIAEGREPLGPGDWIICTRLPEDELADEESLFENRPYLHYCAKEYVMNNLLPWEQGKGGDFIEQRTLAQRYKIIVEHPYNTHGIGYADSAFEHIDSLDRVFRYSGGEHVYTASVIPRLDKTDYVYVALAVGFYKKNLFPQLRKHSLRFYERHAFSGVAAVMSAVSRRGNRVLFFKENGNAPTPNMAAVRDRMLERGLDGDFEIVERYRNIYGGVLQNPFELLEDIRQIAKSDYIFVDDYCPVFNFVKPKKGTVLTQIWHAGVGFKSVGYARFGMAGSPHAYSSVHRAYTYALVGNEHLRKIYSEVFGIEQEALLATGMPRLDHFLDEGVAEAAESRLLEAYPWLHEGRVILFAPTFRGPSQSMAYYPYDAYFDMEALFEMCERTNSYFIFAMHPFVKERPPIPDECAGRIFDLTKEGLTDLYHVSDVLVTDYSSCFYDYLLLRKPVVFYVPDKVSYAATRGVQRTVDEMAPGVVCNTFDEFMSVLASGEYEGVEPDPSCLDRKLEGGMLASDRVIDTVLLDEDVPGVRMLTAREDGGREDGVPA